MCKVSGWFQTVIVSIGEPSPQSTVKLYVPLISNGNWTWFANDEPPLVFDVFQSDTKESGANPPSVIIHNFVPVKYPLDGTAADVYCEFPPWNGTPDCKAPKYEAQPISSELYFDVDSVTID